MNNSKLTKSTANTVVAMIFGIGMTLSASMAAAGQPLSSPIGASPTPAKVATASNAANTPGDNISLPAGQGAGYFSPDSIFQPLAKRDDVIPWSLLTSVKTKKQQNRILPVFTMDQMALNQKTQRIQGYMMPLDPGETQKHFLLSSVPLTCPFCMPGGPESIIEIKSKTPVKYGMEPVVVEGRFLVLNDDSNGLYYRMTDATGVR